MIIEGVLSQLILNTCSNSKFDMLRGNGDRLIIAQKRAQCLQFSCHSKPDRPHFGLLFLLYFAHGSVSERFISIVAKEC